MFSRKLQYKIVGISKVYSQLLKEYRNEWGALNFMQIDRDGQRLFTFDLIDLLSILGVIFILLSSKRVNGQFCMQVLLAPSELFIWCELLRTLDGVLRQTWREHSLKGEITILADQLKYVADDITLAGRPIRSPHYANNGRVTHRKGTPPPPARKKLTGGPRNEPSII